MGRTGRATLLQDLRAQVTGIERRGAALGAAPLPFGVPTLDSALPEGGLTSGHLPL